MEPEYIICPNCYYQSCHYFQCVCCSYMAYEHPYDEMELIPYLQYIQRHNDKKLEERLKYLKNWLKEARESKRQIALELVEKQVDYVQPVKIKGHKKQRKKGEGISVDPLQGFGAE